MDEITIATDTIQTFGAGGTAVAALWTFMRMASKISTMVEAATKLIELHSSRVDESRKHEEATRQVDAAKLEALKAIEKNTRATELTPLQHA